MDEWLSKPTKIGVLASGGAPNLHLIAGALCAFYENKRSFDVIGASGAGALAGLLYAVPKQPGGQVAALEQTVNINVSDAIYQLLPMNYKTFFKRGPLTKLFWLPRGIRAATQPIRLKGTQRAASDSAALSRLYGIAASPLAVPAARDHTRANAS